MNTHVTSPAMIFGKRKKKKKDKKQTGRNE